MDFILELGSSLGTVRVPGIGLVYNELVQGIPSLFGQFLVNLPAIHSTIVFVSIKYVPVPKVSQEERFLFRRVCQKDFHMFRLHCTEAQELALEISSVELSLDNMSASSSDRIVQHGTSELQVPLLSDQKLDVASSIISSPSGGLSTLPSDAMTSDEDPSLEYELSALREAMESGFTYLLAHSDVRATKESVFLKKFVINYFYAFLRRNCRASFSVPHMNIIEVGMTYMV
ncbi:hypothetical protein J5N97_004992 [Dioscorea zingiberensis]|uniref:K+ potassium transporter C-terminal domain-containing protein n=1 Tax=Dioscorea zingiberensis TaxID=325984 RepID=A0A9D5D7R5_9LILI|nr:hypothetical protein J5N97_004992 [Dioscorea zingiberensis]